MKDEEIARIAKEHEERKAEARKRSLKDYKEFRHHSNIPYDCVLNDGWPVLVVVF